MFNNFYKFESKAEKDFPDVKAPGEKNQKFYGALTNTNAFIVFTFCRPELVSGSHNILILLDAETSSA